MKIQVNRVYPTTFRILEHFFVTDVTDEFVSGYHVPFGFEKEIVTLTLQRNFFEGMVKSTAESKARQFDHLGSPQYPLLRERADDMRAILEDRDRPEKSIYDFVYIDLLVKPRNYPSSNFNDFWDHVDRLTGGCCNSMRAGAGIFECSMTGVNSLVEILQDQYVEPVGVTVTAPKELMSPNQMPDLLREIVTSLPSVEVFDASENCEEDLLETNGCGDKPKVRG